MKKFQKNTKKKRKNISINAIYFDFNTVTHAHMYKTPTQLVIFVILLKKGKNLIKYLCYRKFKYNSNQSIKIFKCKKTSLRIKKSAYLNSKKKIVNNISLN